MKYEKTITKIIQDMISNAESEACQTEYIGCGGELLMSRISAADIAAISRIMADFDCIYWYADVPKTNMSATYEIWVNAKYNYAKQPDLYWGLRRLTE